MYGRTLSALPPSLQDSERERMLQHLQRAEREIGWLRVTGMLSWAYVLHRQGFELGLNAIWVVYALGLTYTVWAFRAARMPGHIRAKAVCTAMCDPLLAASICFFTGGLHSVFFPFFYFTQLAASFRFGVAGGLAIVCLNFLLAFALYYFAPGPALAPDDLLLAIFYVVFAGALGTMLAKWAMENIDLVLAHSRSLLTQNERSRELLRRLINAQEDERKRIASELHDRMSGHMFNLQHRLDRCTAASAGRPELQRLLWETTEAVHEATNDVRSIMNQLRPTVLDELGFHEAATEYLGKMAGVVPFKVTVWMDPALRQWRSRQDALLFRLLQEALLNIRKHAAAEHVDVRLEFLHGNSAELTIFDDGKGFDPSTVPLGHYGIMTMRERAEALGGTFSCDSGPEGKGTCIVVKVPLESGVMTPAMLAEEVAAK